MIIEASLNSLSMATIVSVADGILPYLRSQPCLISSMRLPLSIILASTFSSLAVSNCTLPIS